ncbi:MAG: Flp pilus assembly complex ATPase component TadA [Alphaproteobacteria bacterium]|jgi:pilus assembly protein CpaF|nr:Flp pilus assembly complex ATPase component TadA [Alphaproteobacteria bacterium]QQS56990.1 MAG: Flp pilus assembly complex ATPase component TadA [Alphaproteobacteria bacterium]
MFGKKTTGGQKPPPVKSGAAAKPSAPAERIAPKVETPAPVSFDLPSNSPEPVSKPNGSAPAAVSSDNIGAVLSSLGPQDESKEPSASPAQEAPKAAPSAEAAPAKQRKTMKDDELLSDHPQEDEHRNHGDSITALRLQRCRNRIWLDLRDGIDLKALARMDAKAAREEVYSAVEEIARFRNLDLTPAELAGIAKECADDMLGFGPLEELLERDDIADIMINGPDVTYIEVGGKIEKTNVKFRDSQHLITICQRIVGAIGRRVDEASPICDARLPDGSRVNVIIPPLSVDGAAMTIRKFKKDKLTLEKLLEYGSMTPSCAKLIMAVGRCRVNVLVSGGTGSGKTTMLNCLTRYIEAGERIITCEDACELQLQQPHVVRLETRPPNLEGVGEITMRDLVRNCLRMRPERIIVGEVRGPEAFDLLQAMNTGHDGSMGTVHANNPREAISRMENMIAMGGLNLPQKAVREQIASAVNVIIQVQRLRDGSRKTTHVSEVTGMEGDVVTMQDLFYLEILGEDEKGKLITRQRSSGLRPKFYDNARQFGVEQLVLDAMEEAYG